MYTMKVIQGIIHHSMTIQLITFYLKVDMGKLEINAFSCLSVTCSFKNMSL